jgi:hypothetical protein
MKTLFVAILFVSILLQQGAAPSPRIPKQKNTENAKQSAEEKKQSSKLSPPATERTNRANPAKQNRSPTAPDNREQSVLIISVSPVAVPRDRTDKALLTFSGILALAAVVQLFFLIRSANAAKNAAVAARRNAEALISGDRAWLLVDKTEEPYIIPPEAQPDPTDPRAAYSFVILKNFGKTPAKLTAWKVELQIGDSWDRPNDESVYDLGRDVFNPSMIPQGETMPLEARLSSGFITAQQLKQVIEDKSNVLWFCGTIKYQDVFSTGHEHETRFCKLYETRLNTPRPLWRLAGPPDYNKET